MRGLKPKHGFVDNRVAHSGRGRKSKFLVSAIVLLLLAGGLAMAVFVHSPSAQEKLQPMGIRAVQQDFGAGYKNPQVVPGGEFFVVGTVSYGKLSIILINGTDGSINSTFGPVSDVNSWYFRIAVDPENKAVLIVWNNGTYLNGTYLYVNSTGEIVKSTNFTVASGVGTTSFGLAYGDGVFFVVWSDSSFKNFGRTIKFNPADPDNPTLGTIFGISDDSHSHASNFVAYDNVSNKFLVLWRNYSGITGLYNITGRLFDSSGNALSGDILVANGVAANTKYDYPTAEGGSGDFFVAYVNVNSPYDIHGVMLNAADGSVGTPFTIGNTYKYGASFTGIAYNGTGYIVTWTNESSDIVAMKYDVDGNAQLSKPLTVAGTSDSEEWQDVAYNNETGTYYFVWYDYTSKHDYGSLWTEDELVPELNAVLPILVVALVAIIFYRRKH